MLSLCVSALSTRCVSIPKSIREHSHNMFHSNCWSLKSISALSSWLVMSAVAIVPALQGLCRNHPAPCVDSGTGVIQQPMEGMASFLPLGKSDCDVRFACFAFCCCCFLQTSFLRVIMITVFICCWLSISTAILLLVIGATLFNSLLAFAVVNQHGFYKNFEFRYLYNWWSGTIIHS